MLDNIGGDVLRGAFGVVRIGSRIVSAVGQKEVRPLPEALAHRYGVKFVAILMPGQKGVRPIPEAIPPESGIEFVVIRVLPSGERMAELARLFDAGQLRVRLDAVIPLKDAAQAHTLIEGGHVRGKLVLSVE